MHRMGVVMRGQLTRDHQAMFSSSIRVFPFILTLTFTKQDCELKICFQLVPHLARRETVLLLFACMTDSCYTNMYPMTTALAHNNCSLGII